LVTSGGDLIDDFGIECYGNESADHGRNC
jgi:hypothetical protein